MTKHIAREKKKAIVFCYLISLAPLVYAINAITLPIIGETPIDTIMVYTSFLFLFANAFLPIIKSLNRYVYSILCFTSINILIAIMLSQNPTIISDLKMDFFNVLMGAFFGLIVGASISDYKVLKTYLLKTTNILSILMIIGFLINQYILQIEWGTVKMPFSYMLLLATMGEFWNLKEKFSLYHLVFFIVNIFIQLIFGSRGPILVLFVFIVLTLLLQNKINKTKMIRSVFAILIMLLGVVGLLDYQNLLLIEDVSANFGVTSKTVSYLLIDDILYDNGRDILSEQAIELIQESPAIGYGMFSDRYKLGTYTHNIVTELFVDFGIVIGMIIFVFIVYLILKGLFFYDFAAREITAYFLSIGFVKLFFSSSFWEELHFWILIGLCLSIATRQKNDKLERKI
ncbi:MAG: hypothetical protein H6Q66_630 [Firmicutes bacterium]|nr:hypothetical protein [Bacillota bacterium]